MIYTFKRIEPTETIGDSLSTVNQNYNTLSKWIADIQTLYDTTFLPLYDFYIKYANRMDETLTTIQSVSSEWRSFQTTVQVNSAKWLQPFSIWYPNLLPAPFTDASLTTVKSWLDLTFPVKNPNGSVNYVDGQEFLVSCHTYRIEQKINALISLIDYTRCTTANTTIYAYCSDTWRPQSIVCKAGGFNCAWSRSCRVGATSNCYYLTPYYTRFNDTIPIGTTNPNADKTFGYGKIEATVTAKYTDRYENTAIRTISFRVVDCNWTFNRYVTA